MDTTGFPIAIAARILFLIPAPYRMGHTHTPAACMWGRMSSTLPVTWMPFRPLRLRTSSSGSAPTTQNSASGTFARIRGKISSAQYRAASTFGP